MRLVMMGTGGFAAPTFQALLGSKHQVVGLVTQPDRPVGEKRGSTRQTGKSMKEIALEGNLPILQPESINTPEGVQSLQALTPDLLVVAAYGQILAKDVLAVTPHGGINVHASLLPKYRGAAPIAWAIYHGEKKTGVTIIKMSVQLDAGDMLAQEAIDIGPEETAGELEVRLAALGARMSLAVIDQIAAGTARGMVQEKAQATKAPKLTKEHGVIDWSRTASEVCRHVRAMQPWPTAYTFLHSKGQLPLRLIVQRAGPAGDVTVPHPATGGVLASDAKSRLWVSAGAHSWVEILELQPAGKKSMAAADFLRGHALQTGDRLGPESSRS